MIWSISKGVLCGKLGVLRDLVVVGGGFLEGGGLFSITKTFYGRSKLF